MGSYRTYSDGVYKYGSRMEVRMDKYGPDRMTRSEDRTRDSDDSVVSLDSEGKQKSFTRVMQRFAEKTSMQGVPYIHTAKLRGAKIIWAILLFLAMGMMVLHLYYLGNQFFLWPKQTSIELGFNNLQLPAITVCNVNIIRNSKLEKNTRPSLGSLKGLINAVDPTGWDPKKTDTYTGGPAPPGGGTTGGGSTGGGSTGGGSTGGGTTGGGSTGGGTGGGSTGGGTTGGGTATGGQGGIGRKRKKRAAESFQNINLTSYNGQKPPPKDTHVGPRDAVSDIEDTFKSLYMQQPRATRVSLGHTMDDMLVSCAFNGQTCYPENFTLYQTPQFGNCYTIESGLFITKSSGPSKGLKLILYLDNRDYVKGITQGHGARVTLHYPGTIPDPEDMGFYVSTAFETDIGLKFVEIKRESQPYGSCTEGTAFEQKYSRKYTRQACLGICTQEAMLAKCGCYAQDMQEVFYVAGLEANNVCTNTSDLECQASIEGLLEDKTISCDCDNPCSEIQYVKTFSTRQWPTEDYSTVLVQTICEDPTRRDDCQHLADIMDRTELSANFLKLVVYYEDLNYEKIEETPEIEPAQFASDVGGAIGLWIGLSMLSMFEVVQLILELCHHGYGNCEKDNARKERARRKRQQRRLRQRQQAHHNNGREDEHPRAMYGMDGGPPSYSEPYNTGPVADREVEGFYMYQGRARAASNGSAPRF